MQLHAPYPKDEEENKIFPLLEVKTKTLYKALQLQSSEITRMRSPALICMWGMAQGGCMGCKWWGFGSRVTWVGEEPCVNWFGHVQQQHQPAACLWCLC